MIKGKLTQCPICRIYPCEGHTIFAIANQCSICACEFQNGEKVRITKCGYCFHNKCTRDMIKGKLTQYPICRITMMHV
ncbi:hypothetical protein F8388_019899 [Cannabis sativa]|uniref:RING-type domain-containing protein n=1 Tax=Cannabis sativa TaxID=3483 RepID=A0A7J6H4U3_CANSA|nr:hypothetical protein F8388_019899 [Cannabis sativa]